MERAAITSSADDNYPALFRTFVVRSAAYQLEVVRLAGNTVSQVQREQALHVLRFALDLPEAWTFARGILIALAPPMERTAARDDWMEWLRRGLVRARACNDVAAEAELCLQAGILLQLQTRYVEAREELERGLELFEALGQTRDQARTLNRLAQVARRQKRLAEAQRLVEMALARLETGDPECAYSYLALGNIQTDHKAWQEALQHFERSLELLLRQDDWRLKAWCLTNLGLATWGLAQYETAAAYFQSALALYRDVGDPVHEALANMNLGNVYVALQQPRDALVCYLQAEPVFRQAYDLIHLAMVNNDLGIVYRTLRDWPQATHAYHLSVALWRQIGHVAPLVNAMDGAGLVHLAEGRNAEAAAVFREALDLLAAIEQEPDHGALYDTVLGHLRDTLG